MTQLGPLVCDESGNWQGTFGCDGCGTLGWNWGLLHDHGWLSCSVPSGYPGGFIHHHHCPNCVGLNNTAFPGQTVSDRIQYDKEQTT